MLACVRLGDTGSGHPPCYPPRANTQGSSDVFANNIGVHRIGDSWPPHGSGPQPCPPHPGTQSSGSSTVFANSLGIARVGDAISCGSTCVQGSGDVFCG